MSSISGADQDASWEEQTESYERRCDVKINQIVFDHFVEEWELALAPARQRSKKLNAIILGKVSVDTLLPFGDLLPPDPNSIIAIIESSNELELTRLTR